MKQFTSRQRILMLAVLGATKTEELYDVFEHFYDKLSPVETELALELSNYLININADESELLDDVIANYMKEEI